MFRIRRIQDDVLPANRRAIQEVQQICADQFPDALQADIANLSEKLRNPLLPRFRLILLVADRYARHFLQGLFHAHNQ